MGNNPSRNVVYDKYYEALQNNRTNVVPDMDPYEVLGVSKDFEWEELKIAYKRVAKLVHPDKGGSEVLFNAVTECFRKLAHEYKARQEKTHVQLRSGAQEYYREEQQQRSQSHSNATSKPHRHETPPNMEGNFNEKFNRAFESSRLDEDDGTSASTGYGGMMAKSTKEREDFAIPQVLKKYNATAFNRVFETTTLPDTKEIVKYREPEPLPLAKSIQYTELGKASTGDVSSTQEGEGRRTLQYTDYMKAYTTTRLVDPRAVQERKTYRNVDEYESARAEAASAPVSDEEKEWREKREREAERAEVERLKRLQTRDQNLSLHYENVSRKMLR